MTRLFTLRARILTAAVAAAALVVPVSASAETPTGTTISCGETITASITVANDLTCSGTALSIGADNVTVDLGGHTLTGDGTGDGVDIGTVISVPRLSGDAVQNGTITGFAVGVKLYGVVDVGLIGLTLTDEPTDVLNPPGYTVGGLTIEHCHAVGDAGVFLQSLNLGGGTIADTSVEGAATNLDQTGGVTFRNDVFTGAPINSEFDFNTTIVDSRFVGSEVSHGGGFGGVFEGNVFTNAGMALEIDQSPGDRVADNVFTGDRVGVRLGAFTAINAGSVTGNRFVGGFAVGLLVDTSGAMTLNVSDNNATGNGFSPIGAGGGTFDSGGNQAVGGIHVYVPGGGPTVTDNRTANNSGYGIWTVPGTVTGSGNVSIDDQFGCDPADLCAYPRS